MAIVYLNGEFIPRENASVSVMDRGFLFGDGVYEVIPVYHSQPLRLTEHLDRLQNSLDGIKLSNPYSDAQWQQILDDLIAKNEGSEQSIYLQITRGAPVKRDHGFPDEIVPTIFIMSNPIPDLPCADSVKPANATTLEDIRWQLCHLKTVALLGNVLLKQEALDRGFDEAVLVRDGMATECSASNLFMVKDNTLVTPPKSNHLLPGITRDLVVDVARANDIQIIERDIEEKELFTADELWFTSSTKAIVPIITLNGTQIGNGTVGAMWQKTMSLYRNYVEQLKKGEAK